MTTTHPQIFVNLPVKDLDRSVKFFTALGYAFNPAFTDENATCMILGENLFAMLLVEKYFATFTTKPVSDAGKSTEVLVALPMESREAVDEIVAKAVAAGGTTPREAIDHGFMYGHGFEDLDGHVWEVFHMSGEPPQE
ncbi:VOC family protein [Marilutibacter alkalisoli]|uniref:Glyoxalase/bleomycin resistance/extradiol dioxygenase family protein n=1 Tax=Marilutibacter alkalisoli TaxID=2591633 RepID=A0A514BQ79_9GAMM|nr:VOC family protein [Lysobacter alkalisoli]QDH69562.1 glyoxalase/bleomycin resistance/extradiol dioxygenase family protein [Lysobacter alkalisoli]